MKPSKKQYSCVVIDDDQSSIEVISHYIKTTQKLYLINNYTNPVNALKDLHVVEQIDFLFLDIEMFISGLEIGRLMRDKVRYLIFVTAHEQYALDAFQASCDQFIMKPVSFEKFLKIINQVIVRDKKHKSSRNQKN